MSDNIIPKLVGLQRQATLERSHYYVGNVAQEAIDEIKDLQQKLLQSQASEARLREVLSAITKAWFQDTDASWALSCIDLMDDAEQALSTPPNTAELEAYVESEIDKRLGEPVAWLDLNKVQNGMAYATSFKASDRQTKLYARKAKQ